METRILSDVALYGALIMSNDATEFPVNPSIGTIIIKNQCIYAYIKVGGLETWYPFASKTDSYIHVQGLASTTWVVHHNLGTTDIWYQLKDSNGNLIIAAKTDIDENTFEINLTSAAAGTCIVVAPQSIDVPEVKASLINVGSGAVMIDSSGVQINGSYALTSANIAQQISDAIATKDNSDEITEGTTHLYYTNSRARAAISVTNISGDGSLLYDAGNGIFTYTGPSESEVRAHFSAGTGITLTNGSIAVDNTIATVSALNNEITRSANAESTITSNLNSEITRSINAESTLSANILIEKTRAVEIETTLSANLNNEITRSVNSEATLSANILVEKSRALSAESTLLSAINAEKTRAMLAESSFSSSIQAIGSAFNYIGTVSGGSQGSPTSLTGLAQKDTGDYYKVALDGWFNDGVNTFYAHINDGLVWNLSGTVDKLDNSDTVISGTSSYISVSGSTDNGYTVDVDSAFKTRVSNLETSLNNEITRSTGVDTTLTASLNNEVTRSTNAELTLTSNLNAEITRGVNAEATITTSLNNEITRSVNADSTLTANILVEKTRSLNAESTLTSNLNDEITRSTNAESTLTSSLNSEITRSTNAESTLSANILVEKTRATNAETLISIAISGKEPTISSGTTGQYWRGDKTWQTLDKSAVGLGNVENTALSTWTGSSNLTTAGALTAASLSVTGNLTINGTTTTVNSTTVTLDDPILTLGGDIAPTVDDGKDRGIEFRYHNGVAAKVGFFGFDDSTGKFTFVPDATNTSEVFSGTKGTIDANIEWADILNKPSSGTGSGTVTSVSVVSANGLAGTVATASSTPAITLSTTITGMLKGNGTAISAASAGTDFMAPASTINLGTTNFALNRASASQSLTGVSIDGNAGTATALATGRTIGMTGDVTWTSASFDGSAAVSGTATLATITDSGTGTFKKITTNTKGLVTGTTAVTQSDITGLLGAGSITNTMLANGAVANLSGTNTGDETLSTIKTKLGITTLSGSNTGDQTITLTGDVTGSGTGSFAATLATVTQSTGSSFVKITLDTKGRVTGNTAVAQADITGLLGAGSITNTMLANSAVANLSGTNTGDQTITLTGDVTGSGTGSFAATLATITDSGTGTFKKITTNTKGLVTGTAAVAQSDITGLLGSGSITSTMLGTLSSVSTSGAITSTLATGTAPLTVASTTLVTNLNADMLDGQHGSYYAPLASPTFTGTVSGITKSMVGLGSVENTALSTWAGSSNLTTAGALTAASLSVTGNLTVNGTTTTVHSTTVTLDDPILTLGGDTAPTVDDNKDRGVEFRWHNGTAAKVGFFGFDDSTGYLTFIPDATNTSEVFSGTMGDIQATNFRGALVGNASTATALATGRTIGMTGDVTWTSASFDGSGNVTGTSTLATVTQSTGSSFVKITLDTKGRVTGNTAVAQSDITGLLGAGSITNTMLANGAVANLSGTNTGDETLSTIKTKLGITTLSGSNTGDQTITLTGDVTGSGTGSFAATLATITDSGTGTFKKITTNTKGLVTGTAAVAQADITGLLGAGSITSTMLGTLSSVSTSGVITSTLATGTAPLTVASATLVSNLNADLHDGKHIGTSGNAVPLLDGTNTWSGTQTFGTTATAISNTITTSTTTTSVTPTTVSTFASATYRSATYQVQVVSGTTYNKLTIDVIHDGTTATFVRSNNINIGVELGTFDVSISSGTLSLMFTAASSASTTVKVLQTAITV
jgi:hypothetical protein